MAQRTLAAGRAVPGGSEESKDDISAAVDAVLDPAVLADEGDTLVHRVTSAFGVGPFDRQRLLAAAGTGARLELLATLLDDAIALATLRRDGPAPQ